MNGPLASVTASARSGALAHAWRLFREAGFDAVRDDPAVLAVRARLLKDEALISADPGERQRLYREAGETYGRAGAVNRSTYPLINAATLALLGGDRAAAEARALAVLEQGDDPEETPYYRAATRAEALLLLGRHREAKAATTEALKRAPHAWEDHASTLRQFRLIAADRGEDAAWLDILRPPRCLHFAGHMALAADAEALGHSIRVVLEAEDVGFGFGALAAGADIVIAEALLERGAELHLTLPVPRDHFKVVSVVGFGSHWADRFEAMIARAETVRVTGRSDVPRRSDMELAAEAAMGASVMKARTLLTEAVQLLVLDDDAAGISGAVADNWRRSGRRQHRLTAPRHAPRTAEPETAGCLRALLSVSVSDAALAPRLAEVVAGAPPPLQAPRWSGTELTLAYGRPADAAAAAARVAGLGDGVRVGGHYAVIEMQPDPFGGPPLPSSDAAALAERAADSAPGGAIHLTETFAAALHAGADDRLQTEFVGELAGDGPGEPDTALYALRCWPESDGAEP